MRHADILRFVVERGARVNAKDAVGFTALHHITCPPSVTKIARVLLVSSVCTVLEAPSFCSIVVQTGSVLDDAILRLVTTSTPRQSCMNL